MAVAVAEAEADADRETDRPSNRSTTELPSRLVQTSKEQNRIKRIDWNLRPTGGQQMTNGQMDRQWDRWTNGQTYVQVCNRNSYIGI